MTTEHDFIVTIHALERIGQRFGAMVKGMGDREQAELIHTEVMAAIDAGREAKYAPLELAPSGRERWIAMKKDSTVVWNEDKKRGYVICHRHDGLFVLTVLIGNERGAQQQRVLQRGIRK